MPKFHLYLAVFICEFVVFSQSVFNDSKNLTNSSLDIPPTFCEVVKKNGKSCEVYNVTTEDGYILGMFRIPGNASRPVLLMHGILDSSDAFVVREDRSLALTLANHGYDVWTGNNRGNRYSRRHVRLDPDKEEFWDYTFHEMGIYDLPSLIDFTLDKTGQSKLSAFGHSEGSTIFFVLGAMKPEYNDKVKFIGCLAPVAYLHNMKGPLVLAVQLSTVINLILKPVTNEIFGYNSIPTNLVREICKIPKFGYVFCVLSIIFPAIGPDPEQFEPDFLPTFINHYPAGTSRKTSLHYAQVARRREFARFDHGPMGNLARYGSFTPPKYELSKITMDVALYVGKNDFVSTVEDVALLRPQLPNVVEYQVIDYELWNHLDFMYGRFMPKYLFPLLLDLLAKYN